MGRTLTQRNITDRNVDLWMTRVIDFHGRRITNANDAIGDQDYVTKRQLESRVGSGSSANPSIVVSYTMNAASFNVPNVPVEVGKILTVILTQDGTGGRIPVWSGAFYVDAPTAVYYAAGNKAIVGFVENGGKWQWDGRFVPGV